MLWVNSLHCLEFGNQSLCYLLLKGTILVRWSQIWVSLCSNHHFSEYLKNSGGSSQHNNWRPSLCPDKALPLRFKRKLGLLSQRTPGSKELFHTPSPLLYPSWDRLLTQCDESFLILIGERSGSLRFGAVWQLVALPLQLHTSLGSPVRTNIAKHP